MIVKVVDWWLGGSVGITSVPEESGGASGQAAWQNHLIRYTHFDDVKIADYRPVPTDPAMS